MYYKDIQALRAEIAGLLERFRLAKAEPRSESQFAFCVGVESTLTWALARLNGEPIAEGTETELSPFYNVGYDKPKAHN